MPPGVTGAGSVRHVGLPDPGVRRGWRHHQHWCHHRHTKEEGQVHVPRPAQHYECCRRGGGHLFRPATRHARLVDRVSIQNTLTYTPVSATHHAYCGDDISLLHHTHQVRMCLSFKPTFK